MGAHGKIFISYRREDAPGDARGICDRLGRSFGEANVFMDVDRLLAGQRFDRELDRALAKCDVLVAVIGSRWMELLSDYVKRSKRDYVRDEIAAALKRDIIVIPVMIGREANMPPLPLADDLPENIRDLVLYQKHNVAHEMFGRDAADLITAIKAVLRNRRGPRPWRAIVAAGVVGLALAGTSLGYWMDVLPQIGSGAPHGNVGTNATVAAMSNSDAASKRAEEQAGRKAELDAKAADDAARKKAADDEAARKADQQARLASIADCDRFAASPYDADRPSGVAGIVDPSRIDIATAAACDDAMRRNPETGRFIYQAGRAAFGRKDYLQAELLFRKAIAAGSAAALAGLGVLYTEGFGIAQNYAEARNLFEKGAAQGNSLAITYLGTLYDSGQGVTQEYDKARSLYEKAAALGNAQAMYDLGVLFEFGHGVAWDYAAARKWYEQAAALGDASAACRLGLIYQIGRGVTQDYAAARNWYERTAALGDSFCIIKGAPTRRTTPRRVCGTKRRRRPAPGPGPVVARPVGT